jgi:predicted Rossmann fold nucleotide-binding protein DprA/Smf involved in DNA uptake
VDGSWPEIDGEILDALRDGPKSPRDLARELGVSAAGVTSLLLMLAAEGKIRVTRVELADAREFPRPIAV